MTLHSHFLHLYESSTKRNLQTGFFKLERFVVRRWRRLKTALRSVHDVAVKLRQIVDLLDVLRQRRVRLQTPGHHQTDGVEPVGDVEVRPRHSAAHEEAGLGLGELLVEDG